MEFLQDTYSGMLDNLIKKINSLNKEGGPMITLEKRVDLLSFCMGIIERSENSLLSFKETHNEFDIQSLVEYDFKLSEYAERIYKQANKVMEVMNNNMENPAIKLISPEKKVTFAKLCKRTLEISARWHIERMINVFEFDTPSENKAFPQRKPLLEECIYFADRMNATKMGIKFQDGIMPRVLIFAVQPNSGKSFVANVYSLMASCLHKLYYNTSGILRMSNNTANAVGFSNQIKAMIENDKIASIYPEFNKYFSNGKSQILEKTTSEEWKMNGLDPRIRATYFARGRDTAINSIRVFVALIIDDLSDGFDQMNNDEAHQAMTTKFEIDMDSRKDNEDIPTFILGTMFNEFDVPNTIIKKLEDAGLLVHSETFRNVRHTSDYSTVVVTVDCFDENGESYAPKLISTAKLKEKQNALKPYEFDLVYRQFRTSREPRIFDYKNLKTYTKLPEMLTGRRIAVLDPTRRNGADFFSMPVFDFNDEPDDKDAYFIDCIYEQKSLGRTADPRNVFFNKVIKFIIEQNVRELYIENNTSNTIGTLFEEKFKQLKYICKIDEKYTAKEGGNSSKLARILNEEAPITSNIRFPAPSMYPPLHRISQFMTDFTRFDSKLTTSNKKQHDDAPDSIAMFSKRYLFGRQNRYSVIKGINKASLWLR